MPHASTIDVGRSIGLAALLNPFETEAACAPSVRNVGSAFTLADLAAGGSASCTYPLTAMSGPTTS